MVGVKVNEGNDIAPMGEAQKERLREMLEPNPLEELWAEADDYDAENRLQLDGRRGRGHGRA
eukprot:14260-Rhodomonas_salina.1